MTIYIVYHSFYDSWEIVKCYTSKDTAEEVCKQLRIKNMGWYGVLVSELS